MIFNFRQLHRALTPVLQALLLIVTISFVYKLALHYTFGFPLLIEGFFQIICSEVNRYKQDRRYKRVQNQADLGEKGNARTECVGMVIGYREDPSLFRQCLESYRNDTTRTVRTLVIGIDGNEPEDMPMVDVAESVYGAANLTVIKLDKPFGALASEMIDGWKVQQSLGEKAHQPNKDEFFDHVCRVLVGRAAALLQDLKLLHDQGGDHAAKAICITQPHMSKKDIMFSAFLFSLALARTHQTPFIWSSDSDTYFDPSASPIHRVLATMAADPSIAGSCGALNVHNPTQSPTTRLIAATYLTDLALTSGQNSAFDVTDCQPGPCAAFLTPALSSILVPWYTQTVLSTRPLVNEDRHLTTLLLARGFRTTFHPSALLHTAAPSTAAAWIVQQCRWSRAIVLETLAHPRVLAARNPMLALYAVRRIAGPYLQAWIVVRYLASGTRVAISSPADIAARVLLCSVYTAAQGGARRSGDAGAGAGRWCRVWPWLCASQVFLQFPQPPVVFWACVTVFDGSWGNEGVGGGAGGKGRATLWTRLRTLGWTWAPFVCVAVWVGLVAAAVCKFLVESSTLVGGGGAEGLYVAAGGVVASMGTFYVFTKG
ncbi:glycosyltransferase family 2 protein [Diplodia corticola]|uniref:Glycosyltransferase family 2 protein n=1 Tax=Diplodia corticola TaxID=236234 RepID=A0A1J9RP34_9PEZI|nr:glycosyltransferase family 2 protein [Diplodia corticola]OJD29684.1 glycosyltransferase family 2 protein [Diplodia corticola]